VIPLLLVFLAPVTEAAPRPTVEQLIAGMVVVDGCVNVYSPDSTIGRPDFTRDKNGHTTKQATGIDIGSMTCPSVESVKEQVVRSRKDLEVCIETKQYGLLLYSQHHPPLQGSVKPMQRWFGAGLRVLNFQYAEKDEKERLGTSSRAVGGLTPLGRKAVLEAMRIGFILDLSHCNEQTSLEAAGLARARGVPVLKNHTAARDVAGKDGVKFADYKRNASDKELKAVAATGGVSCIMCYRPYLRRRGNATTDDYVTHVLHAIKVAGIDHVGISTDGYLDGQMARKQTADGIMDSPRRWFEIAKRLRKRGVTDEQLKKLYGGNLLRVYRKVLR
jgi:microsomal dipeptidase-like Zn-dependent dipeptidase